MPLPTASTLNTLLRQAELRGAPLEPLAAAITAELTAGREVSLTLVGPQRALHLRQGATDVGPLRDRAGVARGMVAAGAATLRWTAPTAGVLDELTALAGGDAPPVDRVGAALAPPPS